MGDGAASSAGGALFGPIIRSKFEALHARSLTPCSVALVLLSALPRSVLRWGAPHLAALLPISAAARPGGDGRGVGDGQRRPYPPAHRLGQDPRADAQVGRRLGGGRPAPSRSRPRRCLTCCWAARSTTFNLPVVSSAMCCEFGNALGLYGHLLFEMRMILRGELLRSAAFVVEAARRAGCSSLLLRCRPLVCGVGAGLSVPPGRGAAVTRRGRRELHHPHL